MDVALKDRGTYVFASFRLDPVRRLLLRDGVQVPLAPRLFDTLLYLVENAGEVVERDELLRAVWGGRVVDEANINQTIFALRKALHTGGQADRFIVTAPTRGYRFTAPISFEADPIETHTSVMQGVVEITLPISPDHRHPAARSNRPVVWVAGWFLVCLSTFALIALVWRLSSTPDRIAAGTAAPFTRPPHSIAILAFANMSSDPTLEYLSDGISEELINALSRFGSLRVAARTSAFSFKGKSATVATIAHALNVGAVLEGSIRCDGSRVRVTAGLVNSAGFEMWYRTFDRKQSELPGIQGEIAQAVLRSLRAPLPSDYDERLALGDTHDPRALDAYLRGMRLGRGMDAVSERAAIAAFAEALTIDPNYAMAYVQHSLALSVTLQRDVKVAGLDEANAQAGVALNEARTAISIAPLLGYAHLAMACALEYAKNDWLGARAEFALASELAPGDAAIAIQNAFFQLLHASGDRLSELASLQDAVKLDPLSPEAYRALSVAFLVVRRYDEALAARRHEEQLEPVATTLDTLFIGRVNVMKGEPQAALQTCAAARDAFENWCLGLAYAALKRPTDALMYLAKVHAALGARGVLGYMEIYARVGQIHEAVKWFEVAHRDNLLETTEFYDPLLDTIRGTVEYENIERDFNLPRRDFTPVRR